MPNAEWATTADMLGRTVLEIDEHTKPAFFNPPAENEELPSLLSSTALGDIGLEELLPALCLILNRRVDYAWLWNNPCETGAFTGTSSVLGFTVPSVKPHWGELGSITHSPQIGVVQLSSFALPTANLSEDDARRMWTFLPELIRRMNKEERFRVAVKRWMEAVAHDVQSMDRLIDLRIALEALYIDSDQGELSFRLALTGAHHLGASFEERKAIQGSLRRFYDLSSRAIHGTEISGLKAVDRTAVEQATKLCRDGIVKVVETKNRPDWRDLLLG